MATKIFLFPRSTYLAAHWWHRLAKVIFWAWFVLVFGYCLNQVILKPFLSCIDTEIQSKSYLGESSDLCGENAVDYFTSKVKRSSTSEIGVGFIFFTAVFYAVLVAPSLLYRLVLYIAKRGDWRDVKTHA